MSSRRESLIKAGLLFLAPSLFLLLYAVFSKARGPFYLALNYDPDYAYLFNALNLITGIPPDHVDHPGTPLQLFAAGYIKLANMGANEHVTITTVLAQAESYLQALSAALAATYSLSLFLLGGLVWKRTGSMTGALLLQATPFLLGHDFFETVRFRPEPMILVIALAMAAILYVNVMRDARESIGMTCLLAFLGATGLATKINFLPFVLLPLFCLRTWKSRSGYTAAVFLFSALWILPLKSHFGEFAAWVVGLATRQGRYGTGEPGLFGTQYIHFLMQFLVTRPMFFFTLALSAAAAIYTIGWQWGKVHAAEKRLVGLLVGLVLTQVVEYLMVAKFGHARYLTPAIAFGGLNWALLSKIARPWHGLNLTATQIRWAFSGVALLITAGCGVSLRELHVQMTESRIRHERMAQALGTDYVDRTVVYYYGCSSQYHALLFGNAYSGHRYTRIIEKLFPNHAPAFLVEEWPNHTAWSAVGSEGEPLERRLEKGETILFAGQKWPWPKIRERELLRRVPTNAVLEIETERQQGDEAIYRIRASNPNRPDLQGR